MWALTPSKSLGYDIAYPRLDTWLDLMYGACYHPCQTRPSTSLVGLLSYRMGSLLHAYGWSSFLSTEVRQSDPSKLHM